MGPEDVFQSYQSWRAHAKRCNSYDTLRAMDERFTRMFAEESHTDRVRLDIPAARSRH